VSIDLPRSVKIGPLRFAVLRHKKVLGRDLWGASHYRKVVIKIKAGIPPQHQAVTLMHEIMHGILTDIGKNDLSDDEPFVERLSEALMDTLWNSPGLLRYLKEAKKR
jgi:hypothetical protein